MKIFVVIFIGFFSFVKSDDYSLEFRAPVFPVCNDSEEIDFESFKCVNKICPKNSNGTYPHCNCTEKYFEFRKNWNICIGVCPDDHVEFDNKCIRKVCPPSSNGTYPHCNCTEKYFEYNQYSNICFGVCPDDHVEFDNKCIKKLCPANSNGTYPHCKCIEKYFEYDQYSNICFIECPDDLEQFYNNCINKVCPPNSNGTYLHCKCTEKNFDYSKEKNICFQVCPENSSGYFPNCTCDDKNMGFDIGGFVCVTCPAEANVDVHHTCDCGNIGKYNRHSNTCDKCIDGSKGSYPNCKCDDQNAQYNKKSNRCELCPIGSSGKIPECVCPNGLEYSVFFNKCFTCDGIFEKDECTSCPLGSNAINKSCVCDGNAKYVKGINDCLTCPEDSTGIYPNCTCVDKTLGYNLLKNVCFKCPENLTTGIYPDCQCSENRPFSLTHNKCMDCPSNTTGEYPKCQCINDDEIFNVFLNRCYIPCPCGTSGIFHPDCECNEDSYYDEKEKNCKSNEGRECPKHSIGIGPNCHCIEEELIFNWNNKWACSHMTFHEFSAVEVCPDPTQIYPNCDVAIKKHALFLLVSG